MAIGFMNMACFKKELKLDQTKRFFILSVAACVVLLSFFLGAKQFISHWSDSLYEDQIFFSKQSSYQKIVLTKHKDDIRLFLDGNLQFSSIDEYRYHESLVHPSMTMAAAKSSILILGGGDGLVVREVLKYKDVESIRLVDLDPSITSLAINNHNLKKLNEGSLENSKVKIIHQDAFVYMTENQNKYDVIIADLPDPNNLSLARLYSREFFNLIGARLNEKGIFVTQATSPFYARDAFWTIRDTLKGTSFMRVIPYHTYVPSFGDWGFVIATNTAVNLSGLELGVETRFLSNEVIKNLFLFEKDIKSTQEYGISSLDDPKVLNWYLKGWRHWK